jgi:protein O-GlcNAc transferase
MSAPEIDDLFTEAMAAHRAGQLAEAEALYARILAANPAHFDARHLSGVAAMQRGDLNGAVALIGAAVAADPENPAYADAYNNLAVALKALGRKKEAVAAYDRVIALRPSHTDALYNRGNLKKDMAQGNAALADYDAVLALTPDNAEAHYNRGVVLTQKERHVEAAAAYETATRIAPDLPFLAGMQVFSKLQICHWDGVEAGIADIAARIERGEKASLPFNVLPMLDSPALQRKAAQIWVAAQPDLAQPAPYPASAPTGAQKIRIAYFSMDFRNHPMTRLIARLIEIHDRQAFEVFGFSYGKKTDDEMRQRMQRAFDTFIDIAKMSDHDAAAMARAHGIDIAIDLAGFTANARPGIFARRAAPVQVNYIGFPGSSGAPFHDYIVGDPVVIPAQAIPEYTEKVIVLPHSYMPNDPTRAIAPRVFSRAELGLPADAFVFCCFNNAYKILPAAFDRWMRILSAVEGSVLWLLEAHPAVMAQLPREAERCGVDGARIIFAPRMAQAEHLARQRAADLFLDTFPYTAHTTASDALWAGLPLVTMPGGSFSSRVAASLLTALGLTDLIAETPETFETLALALANDRPSLDAIRQRLAQARVTTPLFDAELHARHLEAAFRQAHARAQAGTAPEHIYV